MKTILIIDDDDDMRSSIVLSLRYYGYRTIESDNGLAGLSLATLYRPDLIISDIMMPNMNGYMLHESLKDDPHVADIPIILITGGSATAGAWRSDPSVSYLEKPFETDQLVEQIRKMLQERVGTISDTMVR